MPAAAASTISRQQVEDYDALDRERLSLQRQARTLQKQLDTIEEKLLAFVRENGGKSRTVHKFGFVLAIIMKSCAPQWKEEFIRLAGLEKAEEVAAAAAAKQKECFSLQRAS